MWSTTCANTNAATICPSSVPCMSNGWSTTSRPGFFNCMPARVEAMATRLAPPTPAAPTSGAPAPSWPPRAPGPRLSCPTIPASLPAGSGTPPPIRGRSYSLVPPWLSSERPTRERRSPQTWPMSPMSPGSSGTRPAGCLTTSTARSFSAATVNATSLFPQVRKTLALIPASGTSSCSLPSVALAIPAACAPRRCSPPLMTFPPTTSSGAPGSAPPSVLFAGCSLFVVTPPRPSTPAFSSWAMAIGWGPAPPPSLAWECMQKRVAAEVVAATRG